MKKLAISVAITLLLLTIFVGCISESYPLRAHPSLENAVGMAVTDIDRDMLQLTVIILNISEYELITGLGFTVEVLSGRNWRQVPFSNTGGVFQMPAYYVPSNGTIDFTKDLRRVETLTRGRYRIRKDVFRAIDTPIREGVIHEIVAEFRW